MLFNFIHKKCHLWHQSATAYTAYHIIIIMPDKNRLQMHETKSDNIGHYEINLIKF